MATSSAIRPKFLISAGGSSTRIGAVTLERPIFAGNSTAFREAISTAASCQCTIPIARKPIKARSLREIATARGGFEDGNLLAPNGVLCSGANTWEEKMDQTRAREIAKDAAEQASKTVNEATQRVGEQVQPALDQAKGTAEDLANRASEAGRQAMDRAGEFVESVAPQAKQVASNLYDQGAQSGEYVRQYAAQQPLAAMLVAGVIGYALGYLIHRH